jgi:hypothetical protein
LLRCTKFVMYLSAILCMIVLHETTVVINAGMGEHLRKTATAESVGGHLVAPHSGQAGFSDGEESSDPTTHAVL